MQCDCELANCEQHGHRAGGCEHPPMVKVYYHLYGMSQNLCYGCLSFNTEPLRTEDWTIQQRYARVA